MRKRPRSKPFPQDLPRVDVIHDTSGARTFQHTTKETNGVRALTGLPRKLFVRSPCMGQMVLQYSQIRKGCRAGNNVAANLSVSPCEGARLRVHHLLTAGMPPRPGSGLGLLLRSRHRPPRVVGDDSIFPKPFDVLAYPVVVLSENKLRSPVLLLKIVLIKVLWQVEPFANL